MTERSAESTVLVVEDHAVTRLGIVSMLARVPGFRVVAEVASLAAARAFLAGNQPDVIVTDVRLTDGSGIDLLRERRALGDRARFVVLTMFGSNEMANEARAAGADVFLDKALDAEALVGALRSLMGPRSGRSTMAEKIASGAEVTLSPREIEVLALVAEGLTNAEIAQRLAIGWTTVRTHVVHVLQKLGARDRTEAAAIAVRRGILELGR